MEERRHFAFWNRFMMLPLFMPLLYVLLLLADDGHGLLLDIFKGDPPRPEDFVNIFSPSGNRTPFGSCEYCKPCAVCRECYTATSYVYDWRFDRCPWSLGPCAKPLGELSWCPLECAPYIALGEEGVQCTSGIKAFCNARDSSFDTVDGEDHEHAIAHGRIGPNVYVPKGYDASRAYPLVVTLCGRLACGNLCHHYLGVLALKDHFGFIYMAPDNTHVKGGRRYCGPIHSVYDPEECPPGRDDRAYIWSLVQEVRRKYRISDLFFLGWSNGGSMALQMACWHSAHVTATAVLAAGRSSVLDKYGKISNSSSIYREGCHAGGQPSHVLIVHDPADIVVNYELAVDNFHFWARVNGCDQSECPSDRGSIDALPHVKGVHALISQLRYGNLHMNETLRYAFEDCDAGGDTELWTVQTWWSDVTNPSKGLPGYPTFFSEIDAPVAHAQGHINSYNVANDHGESFALISKALHWLMQRQENRAGLADRAAGAPAEAARGRDASSGADREQLGGERMGPGGSATAGLRTNGSTESEAASMGMGRRVEVASRQRRLESQMTASPTWQKTEQLGEEEADSRQRRLESKMMARPTWQHLEHKDCPHVSQFVEDFDSSLFGLILAMLLVPVTLICCAMIEGCLFFDALKKFHPAPALGYLRVDHEGMQKMLLMNFFQGHHRDPHHERHHDQPLPRRRRTISMAVMPARPQKPEARTAVAVDDSPRPELLQTKLPSRPSSDGRGESSKRGAAASTTAIKAGSPQKCAEPRALQGILAKCKTLCRPPWAPQPPTSAKPNPAYVASLRRLARERIEMARSAKYEDALDEQLRV